MSRTKTALVTGGAGFIGSHLADRLLTLGYQVAVVDNLSTGKLENVSQKARFYRADITRDSIEEIFQLEKPGLVFHLAAQISVSQSVRDPLGDAQTNVTGTLRLLEAVRASGAPKLVYSSTGGALYGDPGANPCGEETPIQPLSPYGLSKYLAEQYLELYQRLHRLDYTILRYGNVYGPRQDPHGEAGVVAIFSLAMLQGQRPQIFGDGAQERDFVYVGDVVEANLCAIDKGRGKTFNIGCGKGATVNQIYGLLKKFAHYHGKPLYLPPRPGDVYRISLDSSQARQELGWAPQVDLDEGLRRTVEYFRVSAKSNQ